MLEADPLSNQPQDPAALDLVPLSALDAEGALIVDAPCMRCRYNLRGLKPEASCPECGASILWSLAEATRAVKLDNLTLEHMTLLGRTSYILAGVVLPTACFIVSLIDPIKPDSQSGELGDYLMLMLGGPPLFAFYPMLSLAITALLLIVIRPMQFGGSPWLRLGVYSGIFLAMQYLWLEAVTVVTSLGGDMVECLQLASIGLAATMLVVGVVVVANRLRKRIKSAKKRGAMGWTLFTLTLAILLATYPLTLATAACWTLAAFTLLSIRLLRTPRSDNRWVPWWVWPLWVTGWGVSWTAALELMLIEYAKLPVTQPNGSCYISTAAARGHGWLVGTEEISAINGVAMRVNMQMRRLKACELALLAVWPSGHRACRRLYDWIGPRWAARLRHPLAADAAYLALKPAEWLGYGLLRLATPRAAALVRGLYR